MKNKTLSKKIVFTFLRLILLLAAVSMVSFYLVANSPLDPIESYIGSDKIDTLSEEQLTNIKERWGLDKQPMERYMIWVKNLAHGDWGESLIFRQPVIKVIGVRFKASLALMIAAWILSGIVGLLLGIIAGMYKGRWIDRVIKTISLLFASTPTFWVGLLVLMLFAIKLRWFPIALATPIGMLQENVTLAQRIHHLILPALTLSIIGVSNLTLQTREKLIEAQQSDYYLYAKSRGEKGITLFWRHGLRNIILPALTIQCASFSELFGGSVLAEQVFAYPGLGSATTSAAMKGDVPLLLAIALFSAVFVFVGNLMANILYYVFDPRIREDDHVI